MQAGIAEVKFGLTCRLTSKGEKMKARLKTRSLVAAVSAASVALIGFVAVPAQAAARSTVVVIESNTFTSINSGTPATNIVINGDVGYLTGMSLFHYDDKLNLVNNPIFGSYKVSKNKPGDFEVTYTIAPGRVWSDGAPITAVDLLLSHVLSSSDYAKAAGLPDPSNPDNTPAFDSGLYGGVYDQHVVGIPTVSSDKMSMTVKYDTSIPDYALNGPNLTLPVHALEELAAGKTSLGSAADNAAATAKFLSDVNSKNTAALKAMGTVYSTGYNTTTVDSSTNPLLLVCNGAYQIKSVDNSAITLVANPKYNSGPALSGITTVVIKQGIADGSPSAQALANGDADVYQGQPTADAVAQLKAIKTATVSTTSSLAFEHIELRVASSGSDTYTGPFAMAGGQKAADLRKAFLLAYPRQDIVTKLIQPINLNAQVLNSVIDLPGNPQYDHVASLNGMSAYNVGTQASRTAAALELVKKWYPTAGNGNTPIPVNLLWGSPGNTRRTSEAALVIAAEAAVGFKVTAPATAGWGGKLGATNYDAHFFIFDQTANPQDAQACGIFQSTGGSNYTGINDPAIDKACVALQAATLPASTVTRLRIQIEQAVSKDAFFLGIFQNPEVTAYNSQLSGVAAAPLSPSLFWNFWTWHF
jgi:peptide/nickel transport system substrate-binding protein